MNKIYSRLGWSLIAIYFALLLLPSLVKIFETPVTLPLSFVAAHLKIPILPPRTRGGGKSLTASHILHFTLE